MTFLGLYSQNKDPLRMEFSDELLSFSTRSVFSIAGLTPDLRVHWGKLLSFFYSSRYPNQLILQKEMQAAAQRCESTEQLIADFKRLNNEDKILTIVLLKLLLRQSEIVNQPIAKAQLSDKISLLSEVYGTENDLHVNNQYEECLANLIRHENRKQITVPASILPLALDYIIKWILLIICRINSVPTTDIYSYAFYESILFIGIFIFINYRDRKHNLSLFQKYNAIEDFKIDFEFSAQKYTWIAFFFTTSIIVLCFVDVKDEGGNISDYTSAAVIFLIYYFIGLRIFPSGRISEVSLIRQIESQKAQSNETLDFDRHDEEIIDIETEINSRTGRLDAYVLESALFGALAFSGFLQIIATDFVSFKELEQFSRLVLEVTQNIVSMDPKALEKAFTELYTKNNLFCLAAIETLLCSAFFIAVIASRLRFSNVADKVRRAIEVAKAYNVKGNSQADEERFLHLDSKIQEQLSISEKALKEITPIAGYMEYFRNSGLLMFLLVLISCSLFVTSFLGWFYVAVGAATWVYFNKEFLISRTKEITLSLQLIYLRRPYTLIIISIFFILVGFLFHITLGLENTNFLITMGFLGIGLYTLLLLILMPNYDDRFGAIEKTSNTFFSSKWNIIQVAYGFSISLSIVALDLFAYGNYTTALGVFALFAMISALLNFAVGYYCSKKKWLGILTGAMSLFTLPFAMVSLNPLISMTGRNLRPYLIFLVVSLLAWGITMIWKNLFHRLYRNILLIVALLILIQSLPLVYGKFSDRIILPIPTFLTTLYQHKTYKLDSLSYWLTLKPPNGLSKNDKLDYYKLKSIGYRKHYGAVNGYTLAYFACANKMEMTADSLFKQGKTAKDSLAIKRSLEFVQEQNQINRLFKFKNSDYFSDLEVKILLELKRKTDAIKALNEIINSEADEGIIKKAKERLKEIEDTK